MSKELPYFKFFPDQWLTGDITLEDMNLQGTFINVCATYWAKDCKISLAKLCQRYGEAIKRLCESGLIKDNQGFANISFLDEQWQERNKSHSKNSENGKKGAAKRWGKDGEANGHPIALREDKIKKEKIKKDRVFTKPLVSDIDAYCKERKNGIDSQYFYDKYEGNGWMVGKNKMKDWKAVIRTWEKNNFETKATSATSNIQQVYKKVENF